MNLIERNKYLNLLNDLLQKVTENKGYVCLISGEAGVGKTTLIENFLNQQNGNCRVLSGACDALFTPRPLGPLYDIAEQLNNDLLQLLSNEASRNIIFTTFLNSLLNNSKTNIVIIEDVHWADESTLDLIKFLGRRVNRTKSLILITFRHDEIDSEHPLRMVLGDIPSKDVIRCKLNPLSEKTTNELAEAHGISNLFQITGGNPFLITELLNNDDTGVPVSVKDSLITRLSRLSALSRELAQIVSIIPTYAELWLLKELLVISDEVIDECIHSGILKLENDHLSFKHELSRLAVEESLTPSQRHSLNEKVLNILLKKDDDVFLSRIIHHAENTGNGNVILKYAPLAAKHASKLGAHNLAASLYNNALRFSADQPFNKKLELYEGRTYECYLTGQIEEGIAACEKVIELLRDHADPNGEAENYRKLSRLTWYAGEDEKGETYLRKSIQILENHAPGRTLAMAYSNLSQTYMLRENTASAILWGETALGLAAQIGDHEVEVHALNNIGTAKMFAGDDSGKDYLQKSLVLSEDYNFHDHVSRAYDNFGAVYTSRRNLVQAAKYYLKGIEYCGDKDLSTHELCMTGEMSKLKLYSGEWDEAVERANITLQKENVPVIDRIIPLCILGLIRARRNDPGALKLLNEADLLVRNAGELGKIVTVKAALAETFWLKNELERNDEFSGDGMPDTSVWIYEHGPNWHNGELQYYTWGRPENIYIKNGNLVIEVRHEKYGIREYTSTRLNTINGWKYGRMEIRARLPKGNALWPAIWMMPIESKYGGWPRSGEIDIMENWSRDQERILGTIHTEAYNHVIGTQKGGNMTVIEPWKNYYTYAIEWAEDKIDWFIDDSLYYSFHKEEGAGSDKWPFDHPFRFILNVAVEGFAAGQEATWEKRTMDVDFVRVFRKK